MDGKIFRIEDIRRLGPHSHYNCRSIAVPVTQFEIDEMRGEGKGIEIADPCPGRAAGFSEKEKKFYIPGWPIQVPPAYPRTSYPELSPRDDPNRGRIVTSCPYSGCRSTEISERGRKFNFIEYFCNECNLPFRISKAGDLYFYDAGEERWERVTKGHAPSFYQAREG